MTKQQAGENNGEVPPKVKTACGVVRNTAGKTWKQLKDAARNAIRTNDINNEQEVWGYVVRHMAKVMLLKSPLLKTPLLKSPLLKTPLLKTPLLKNPLLKYLLLTAAAAQQQQQQQQQRSQSL